MSLTKEEVLMALASGKTIQSVSMDGAIADCHFSRADSLHDLVRCMEEGERQRYTYRLKHGPPRDFWISLYADGSQSRLWQSAEACIQAQDITKKLHERLHLREVTE